MKHTCLHDQFNLMLNQLNPLNNNLCNAILILLYLFAPVRRQFLITASQKYNRKD